MKSISRNVLNRFVKVIFIFPLFSMVGSALADVSSIPIHAGSNVLGLAVDPSNGNIFFTAGGTSPFVRKLSPDGSLLDFKQVETGSPGFVIFEDAVVVNNGLYVNVLNEFQGNSYQNITQLSGNGDVLSSFPVDRLQTGLSYIPSSNTLLSINYARDRTNPVFVELALDGSSIQSFKIDDPFLNTPRGHALSASYNPFTQSILALYLDQNPSPQYGHGLAEYKLGLDGQYHVGNIYDIRSVGIEGPGFAMDINRSDGQFYVAADNNRIVMFSLTDLSLLQPIPEPDAYALMLAGLGLMGFMARRRKSA